MNLGKGKDEFIIRSLFFVLGLGYGAVEWETIAGRLSGLIDTSQRTQVKGHKAKRHKTKKSKSKDKKVDQCCNSPIESRIIDKSHIGP